MTSPLEYKLTHMAEEESLEVVHKTPLQPDVTTVEGNSDTFIYIILICTGWPICFGREIC